MHENEKIKRLHELYDDAVKFQEKLYLLIREEEKEIDQMLDLQAKEEADRTWKRRMGLVNSNLKTGGF